jgi:hypothetical protein
MEATRANQRELMAIMKASQEETEAKMKDSLRATEVDPHLGLCFFSQWKMIPSMHCLRSGARAASLNVVGFHGEELNSFRHKRMDIYSLYEKCQARRSFVE